MKRIIPILTVVIIITIGIATFIEKARGSAYVEHIVYDTLWFTLLWAALVISASIYVMHKRLYINKPEFALHLSFVIILIGALVTSLTARHGVLRLAKGDTISMFTSTIGTDSIYEDMPLTVCLQKFEVCYYPGTQTPSDFISHVMVTDPQKQSSFSAQISMSHILNYHGYRFYQTSYNNVDGSSTLSVYYDPWGISITYVGYILFVFASLWLLLNPQGTFRKLLRHPLLQSGFCLLLLFAGAEKTSAQGTTLPISVTRQLERLQVSYGGRIVPLGTMALDFTRKVSGHDGWHGLSSIRVFAGWLFYPESWEDEPMIKMRDNKYCRGLSIHQPACFSEFFTIEGNYRLDMSYNDYRRLDGLSQKAVGEIDEKIQLISALRQTSLLKIFPFSSHNIIVWYAPTDSLPSAMPVSLRLFIRNVLPFLDEAVHKNDTAQVLYIIDKMSGFQQKYGRASCVSPFKISVELLYDHLPLTTLLYKINLLGGLLSLFFCILFLLHSTINRRHRLFFRFLTFFACCSLLFLTFGISLRVYAAGRLPLSNGYETMIALAWFALLVSLLARHKTMFMIPFGFILSGFCLLVATLSNMNPQITNLVPVLHSPILAVHVSLIMMSYALLTLTFLSAVVAVFLHGYHPSSVVKRQIEQLRLISIVLLYPALALLGAGIFMGAVWANVSWGRYWSWDPKEVWALISFLVYPACLHRSSMPFFRRPMVFHLFMIVAFLTVLMTYVGVNFFLGGMHSYATN
jgi:cytochrome c-type biogenesis protein CcsB